MDPCAAVGGPAPASSSVRYLLLFLTSLPLRFESSNDRSGARGGGGRQGVCVLIVDHHLVFRLGVDQRREKVGESLYDGQILDGRLRFDGK